jgi:hypothetical protein
MSMLNKGCRYAPRFAAYLFGTVVTFNFDPIAADALHLETTWAQQCQEEALPYWNWLQHWMKRRVRDPMRCGHAYVTAMHSHA